tara:strand:- start:50 stop:526 length:477 start_codon:yes stop_codon:yes gene_type:complete
MPINNLQSLSSPVLPPASPGTGNMFGMGGFTQANQAMLGNLSAGNPAAPPPTLPIGSGNVMYGANSFSQENIGNVSGVVGMDEENEQAYIPEVEAVESAEDIKKAENKTASKAGLKGAAAGAAIGSVVPILGTAVGGLIGGAIGFFGSKRKQKKNKSK